MSKNKNKKPLEPGQTPAWKQHQGEQTGAKDSNDHLNDQAPKEGMVKIRMKTDYRDVAKAGDVWETDAAKAAELVHAGRAEYAE